MDAVVEIAGFQYRVSKNKVIDVPKIDAKEGEIVRIPKVLAISDGEEIKIGKPFLDNAYVDIKILKAGRFPKILVYKYKRRKKYRRMRGHRQYYTQIEIVNIGVQKEKKVKKETPQAKKTSKKPKSTPKTTKEKDTKKTVKPKGIPKKEETK